VETFKPDQWFSLQIAFFIRFFSVSLCVYSVSLCVTKKQELTQSYTEMPQSYTEEAIQVIQK